MAFRRFGEGVVGSALRLGVDLGGLRLRLGLRLRFLRSERLSDGLRVVLGLGELLLRLGELLLRELLLLLRLGERWLRLCAGEQRRLGERMVSVLFFLLRAEALRRSLECLLTSRGDCDLARCRRVSKDRAVWHNDDPVAILRVLLLVDGLYELRLGAVYIG